MDGIFFEVARLHYGQENVAFGQPSQYEMSTWVGKRHAPVPPGNLHGRTSNRLSGYGIQDRARQRVRVRVAFGGRDIIGSRLALGRLLGTSADGAEEQDAPDPHCY